MAKENAGVSLDAILKELGAFGKYNIVNYALLLFPIFLSGMYGSAFIFEAPNIDYRCKVTQCEHITNTSLWLANAIPKEKDNVLSKCKMYRWKGNASDQECGSSSFDTAITECTSFVYANEDSVVKDFNLGCQDWKRTSVGTFHNLGLFISLPTTGIISDKYGRRLALSIATMLYGMFGFIKSFSVNYHMLIAFEFLEAALGAGAYSTAFVMAMELVGPKGRVFGNTIINAIYVLGLMSVAALAWILQDWRTLVKVCYAPGLLVISYLWLLNESIRWLISKGDHGKAALIIKKAAKMNKVEISEELLSPIYELEKTQNTPESPEEKVTNENANSALEKKESTFLQVIKSSIIRKRLFVCSFLWITCTFVYYGLSINSVSLAGNMYVNFMLVGFVEIPANFACLFALERYGRKRTLISMYVLSACLCIGLTFIPKGQKWWSLVIYLSGKFSITVAYSSVYIYVSEVFPTNVRQALLAVCSSTGRIGSSLAPLTPLLAIYYDNLPAIFFASLALVASLMVFTLPETINMPLPNTIEEAEQLSSSNHRITEPKGLT